MDQDIVKHDNAISSWITLRVARDGVITTILRIETDLTLSVDDPNYQAFDVTSLLEAAVAYVGEQPHIDTIEIEQIRQGNFDVTQIGV